MEVVLGEFSGGLMLQATELQRECIICGGSFQRVPKNRKHVCCSVKCRDVANKRLRTVGRAQRRGSAELKCQSSSCGSLFVPGVRVWATKRYCSMRCYKRECQARYRNRHPKRVLLADQKRRWGGVWWLAMQRDGFACQLCGTKEKLMVHHLDGEGETGAKHHVLENLQTVCGPCHRAEHKHTTVLRIDGKLYVRLGDKQYEVIEKDVKPGG